MFLYRRRSRKKGFTLLSILMALAIIGILSGSYLSTEGPDGKPFSVTVQERARNVVTVANLRTAQTEYFMKTEGRRPNPDDLRKLMAEFSTRFGQGGRYFVTPNNDILVTTNLDTPMFRDRFGDLPKIR